MDNYVNDKHDLQFLMKEVDEMRSRIIFGDYIDTTSNINGEYTLVTVALGKAAAALEMAEMHLNEAVLHAKEL